MKALIYKGIVVTVLVSVGVITYFANKDEDKNIVNNKTITNSKEEKSFENYSKNTNIPSSTFQNNLDKELSVNIKNLNLMLEQTKEMLKNHNKNNQQILISNEKINELLNLDIVQTPQTSNNSSSFETLNNNDNIGEKSDTSQNNITYSSSNSANSTNSSNNSNNQVTTPSINSPSNSVDTKVPTQIVQLQAEIENVKQIINKLNSNKL